MFPWDDGLLCRRRRRSLPEARSSRPAARPSLLHIRVMIQRGMKQPVWLIASSEPRCWEAFSCELLFVRSSKYNPVISRYRPRPLTRECRHNKNTFSTCTSDVMPSTANITAKKMVVQMNRPFHSKITTPSLSQPERRESAPPLPRGTQENKHVIVGSHIQP